MRNVYFAIWYGCNQHCLGCPIGFNDNLSKSLTSKQIREYLDSLDPEEELNVTLSGGEPTLHPEFFEILDDLRDRGADIGILSNGERFGDKKFSDEFLKHIDLANTTIITTIHSSHPEVHEKQNGSKGSFERSIKGLQYLFLRGVHIVVKHCITAVNYKDTADFIRFVDDNFHPLVGIQLFGIDYCGLSRENAKKLFVPFREMRPYIEEALDVYIERSEFNNRHISIQNIPLCAVDPYYWKMLYKLPDMFEYNGYVDPTHDEGAPDENAGPNSRLCDKCCVKEYCQGTYKTMVEYFGDDTVDPVQAME